jgi:hypothetical protein
MASSTGKPCSNSPSEAQCIHTSGLLSAGTAAASFPKTFFLPLTHAAALGLKNPSNQANAGYINMNIR